MDRRVVFSTSAERRLAAALDWLRERSTTGEWVTLAATRSAADDFLRIASSQTKGLFGVHRATLTQFAAELSAPGLSRRSLAPMTALGVEAMATRVVYAVHTADEIDYFSPVVGTPGFPRALAVTLTELRMEGVAPGGLAHTGAGGPDLSRLLARYEEELASWSLVDVAGMLEEATRAATAKSHRFAGLPILLLDVSPLTRAERGFLAALLGEAPAVLASLAAGDDEGLAAVEEVVGARPENLDEDGEGDGASASKLERLRRYVFLAEVPEVAGEETSDPSLVFFSAPGESRECVEIARHISRLGREGVTFDATAILLRHPQSYLPLVEDALRRAGVPAYFTRGTTRPDPAGRAFLALLACAAEDLSASRFAEYLSLGQVPAVDTSGAPPVKDIPWVEPAGEQLVLKTPVVTEEAPAEEGGEVEDAPDEPVIAGSLQVPAQWERLLVDASVVGGRERWARRLEGLEAEKKLQLKEVQDEEEPLQHHLERQIDRLGHLKAFALPVIDCLAELPTSARWGEWLRALEGLAGLALKRPDSVLALLAELRPMDEVGPVGLDEVREVLTERLSFLQVEPPQRRYGRVFVGTIPEAMGRSFHTVFLPGLAEGLFPRKAMEDPLLLDDNRKTLDRGLVVQERRFHEERLLLRIAAGAAAEQLVVSYPRVDVHQGRPRVPSFYALDVLRAAEGKLPELRQLEHRAAEESASRLGWPAPQDPELAIDDAEYDLAVLDPLLRRPAAETTGQGRFLLDCNPHLSRSLRTRGRRWRNFWSPADGIVDPDPETLGILQEHRPTRRPFSPTALQTFAACPYRFLLYAIHRLRPREELVTLEQLDPLTRGSLFHETQFELFGELKAAGLLPMREADLVALFDLADQVLDRVAARYEEKLAPAIPRVWRSEIESLRTDLRGWIRHVVEAREDWKPSHFEFAFGLPMGGERDPESVPDPATILDGIQLRGSIDLVEADEAHRKLRVTDHKTGLAPRDRHVTIGGGEILQPLLYAMGAETVLTGEDEEVESGRLYYCTQRGEYATVEVPLDPDTRGLVRGVFEILDRAIAEGFLPAAPREGACTYCDYRLICGPTEELRVQRKKRERLEDLLALRSRR